MSQFDKLLAQFSNHSSRGSEDKEPDPSLQVIERSKEEALPEQLNSERDQQQSMTNLVVLFFSYNFILARYSPVVLFLLAIISLIVPAATK